METVNIKFNIDDLNRVLTALGHRPYIEVAQLIDSVQRQAQEQLKKSPVPAPGPMKMENA